jgi:hypothetical protein
MRRALFDAVLVIVLFGSAQAATIKMKDGTSVSGDIVGTVVQKGQIKEADSADTKGKKAYNVSYYLVEGSDVSTIDEEGLAERGQPFRVFGAVRDEKAPVDAEVIEDGISAAEGAMLAFAGEKGDTKVMRMSLRNTTKQPHAEQVVGSYYVDPATHKGKFMPYLQVRVADGKVIRVQTSDVVVFKPRPEGFRLDVR